MLKLMKTECGLTVEEWHFCLSVELFEQDNYWTVVICSIGRNIVSSVRCLSVYINNLFTSKCLVKLTFAVSIVCSSSL